MQHLPDCKINLICQNLSAALAMNQLLPSCAASFHASARHGQVSHTCSRQQNAGVTDIRSPGHLEG